MSPTQDGIRDDLVDTSIDECAPVDGFSADQFAIDGFSPTVFGVVEFDTVATEEIIDLEVADDDDVPPGVSRGSVAGTIVSVIVHVWLLMNLAQMAVEEDVHWYEPPIDARMVEEKAEEEEEIEVVEYELANPDDRELEVREVINAASIGIAQTEKPKQETDPRTIDELIPQVREQRVYDVPEGTQVDERIVVNGTNGEAMIQLESALDRVTWEVAKNLQEKRVLLVWMLDGSGSIAKQREAIAKRLRRVYGELDALQKTDQIPRHEIPLLSAVVSFGEQTKFLTENPTDEFETILSAIQNAPTDPSGVENVFTAVKQVLTVWSRFRVQQHRRIMLVAVTDEAGDDFADALEPSIALCQRNGAKAYVIGPSAVFGRRKGFVPYQAPENGQTYQLPIDLGPESAVIEVVDLPFWYSGDQYTYLSSGYAPYALARLVHETGGIYFMTNTTTMSGLSPLGVFDSASLKPFTPDYSFGSPAEYQRDLMKHPLRVAVVKAAFLSREYKANGTPRLDLRVTPANFRQLASDAQKTVAVSQLAIDTILQAFPDGIEEGLTLEPSARWRVNFALTYGRLLAQKVRSMEYNFAFAAMKVNLSNEEVATKSNHWIVRPDTQINYAGNYRRVADKSRTLLELVIDEAPGTPWAVLAQRELKDGFGIKIEQRFIPPPPPRSPNAQTPAPRKKVVLFQPEQKKAVATKSAPPPKPPVLPRL
ncbi:MAG: VWA domain-containing protein [Planctomycetota bacterium]|nr:VWA domain-containing protein [Planctomycetota bacterium]